MKDISVVIIEFIDWCVSMISNLLIDVDPDINTPNQKWCTDVTEIKVPASGEKLFISPISNLFEADNRSCRYKKLEFLMFLTVVKSMFPIRAFVKFDI